jgi:hypothetical protein
MAAVARRLEFGNAPNAGKELSKLEKAQENYEEAYIMEHGTVSRDSASFISLENIPPAPVAIPFTTKDRNELRAGGRKRATSSG